jgi:hypothetical protein
MGENELVQTSEIFLNNVRVEYETKSIVIIRHQFYCDEKNIYLKTDK